MCLRTCSAVVGNFWGWEAAEDAVWAQAAGAAAAAAAAAAPLNPGNAAAASAAPSAAVAAPAVTAAASSGPTATVTANLTAAVGAPSAPAAVTSAAPAPAAAAVGALPAPAAITSSAASLRSAACPARPGGAARGSVADGAGAGAGHGTGTAGTGTGASGGGRLLSALQWEGGSSGSRAGNRRGGGGGGGGGGGDSPSPQEAFLCALPSLNPLSAAALLASGLSLRGIIAAVCASAAAGAAAAAVAEEEMGGSGGGGDGEGRAFQSGLGRDSPLPPLDLSLLRRLLGPHLALMAPERSLALLAAQLQASNIHVEEEMEGPWEEAAGVREEEGIWEVAGGQYSAWPAVQEQYNSVWASGDRLPDAVDEATALMVQPSAGGGWGAGQQAPPEARQGGYGDPGRTYGQPSSPIARQGGYGDPGGASAPRHVQGPGDGGVYWMEQPMDPRILQQGGEVLGGMGQRGGQQLGDNVMGLQPGQWGGGQGQGRVRQAHPGPPPQAVAGWALPHQQPGQQHGLLQLPAGPEVHDEAVANGMHGQQYQQQYQQCQQQQQYQQRQQVAPAWLPSNQGLVPALNPPGTCPEPARYLPGTCPEPAMEEDADIAALDSGLESLRTLYAASQGDDDGSLRGEGGGEGWGGAADNGGNLVGGQNRRIRRRSPALDGGAFQQAGCDTAWLLGGPGSPAERQAAGPSKRYSGQRRQYMQFDVPGPPPRAGQLPQAGSGQEGGRRVDDDEWLHSGDGDGDSPLPQTPPWLGGDSSLAGEGYGRQGAAGGAAADIRPATRNTVSFAADRFHPATSAAAAGAATRPLLLPPAAAVSTGMRPAGDHAAVAAAAAGIAAAAGRLQQRFQGGGRIPPMALDLPGAVGRAGGAVNGGGRGGGGGGGNVWASRQAGGSGRQQGYGRHGGGSRGGRGGGWRNNKRR